MTTVAFLPARGGSRGIPGKNVRSLCGQPLIYWALRALESADSIDEVVVSTDSDEIEAVVTGFGFGKTKVFRRDPNTATDHASTESAMLEYLRAQPRPDDDLFVLVQATSPFTQPADFDHAIAALLDSDADSLLTCVRSRRFFWSDHGSPINYDPHRRPRRQDFAGCLVENGAFYIQSVGRVLRLENRLSGIVLPYEMPEHTAVELDSEDDWVVAEALMQHHAERARDARAIRMVLTDVDGVLTDGGMYYDLGGDAMKRFHTRDGMAFERLRRAGLTTGIVTGEDTPMVARRARKIGADHVRQGVRNKLPTVEAICREHGITLAECAYIGDDLGDLEVLQAVGLSACPADAVPEVRRAVDYVCETSGGAGCLREFVDALVLPAHEAPTSTTSATTTSASPAATPVADTPQAPGRDQVSIPTGTSPRTGSAADRRPTPSSA